MTLLYDILGRFGDHEGYISMYYGSSRIGQTILLYSGVLLGVYSTSVDRGDSFGEDLIITCGFSSVYVIARFPLARVFFIGSFL